MENMFAFFLGFWDGRTLLVLESILHTFLFTISFARIIAQKTLCKNDCYEPNIFFVSQFHKQHLYHSDWKIYFLITSRKATMTEDSAGSSALDLLCWSGEEVLMRIRFRAWPKVLLTLSRKEFVLPCKFEYTSRRLQ